jgi:hypothetical protein
MKKIALATLLAVAALTATAAEVRLEGQNSVGQNGAADQRVYELGIKEAITSNFAGDIVIKNYRTDSTNALSTRYEAGVTGSAPVGPVGVYTRVAVGEKYSSGAEGYSYYSIEPGVTAKLPANFGASLGYRFQDAFSDGHADQTRTWRAKLGYDINANNNVYIGYDRQRGDSDANITKIGLIHRF